MSPQFTSAHFEENGDKAEVAVSIKKNLHLQGVVHSSIIDVLYGKL